LSGSGRIWMQKKLSKFIISNLSLGAKRPSVTNSNGFERRWVELDRRKVYCGGRYHRGQTGRSHSRWSQDGWAEDCYL
jgi:hypothetical protein